MYRCLFSCVGSAFIDSSFHASSPHTHSPTTYLLFPSHQWFISSHLPSRNRLIVVELQACLSANPKKNLIFGFTELVKIKPPTTHLLFPSPILPLHTYSRDACAFVRGSTNQKLSLFVGARFFNFLPPRIMTLVKICTTMMNFY